MATFDRRTLITLGAFGVYVLCWFFANGYYFGIADHAIHLPYLLRTMDPSYLIGDPLVDQVRYHPSYFWTVQRPLLRVMPIETLYLLLQALSIAVMLGGAMALARRLHPGPHGEWVAAVTASLVLPIHTLVELRRTLELVVLNRTVVVGVLLYALALGASSRYHLAFLIAGLAFLIHPNSAAQVAVLLFVAAVLDRERRRAALTGPLVFVLAASPLVVRILMSGAAGGVPFPAPDEYWRIVRVRSSHHDFPLNWPAFQWLILFWFFALLGAALRYHVPRRVVPYLAGLALLCTGQVVAVELLRVPAVQHMHLWGSLEFLCYIVAVCTAGWLVGTWEWPPRRVPAALLSAVGFAFAGLGIVRFLGVLLSLFQRKTYREVQVPPPAWLMPALAVAVALLLRVTGQSAGFHPALSGLPGQALVDWAREHLPPGARVATPPTGRGPVESFRYGARRAIVGNFRDGGEASFSLAYALEWRARMEALCGCDPFGERAGRRNLSANAARVVAQGFANADAARFRSVASRFGATHAVTESSAPKLDLPLEYEDAEYRLYRIE